MTKLEDLRERFLAAAGDGGGAIYPDALIDQWVEEGINDLAMYVPATTTGEFTPALEGQQTYDLDPLARGVLHVEYPAGQSPPRYLVRRSYTSPNFHAHTDSYDFRDTTDAGTNLPKPQVIISARPTTSQTLRIRWTGAYVISADKTKECPLPPQYDHILLLYCTWRAQQHQLMVHTAHPSESAADLLRHFSTNAERSETAYRRAARLAQQNQESGGPTNPWRMDKWDRAY